MLLYMRGYSNQAANATVWWCGRRVLVWIRERKKSKAFWKSPEQRERNRLSLAKAICERNERWNSGDSKGQRIKHSKKGNSKRQLGIRKMSRSEEGKARRLVQTLKCITAKSRDRWSLKARTYFDMQICTTGSHISLMSEVREMTSFEIPVA